MFGILIISKCIHVYLPSSDCSVWCSTGDIISQSVAGGERDRTV